MSSGLEVASTDGFDDIASVERGTDRFEYTVTFKTRRRPTGRSTSTRGSPANVSTSSPRLFNTRLPRPRRCRPTARSLWRRSTPERRHRSPRSATRAGGAQAPAGAGDVAQSPTRPAGQGVRGRRARRGRSVDGRHLQGRAKKAKVQRASRRASSGRSSPSTAVAARSRTPTCAARSPHAIDRDGSGVGRRPGVGAPGRAARQLSAGARPAGLPRLVGRDAHDVGEEARRAADEGRLDQQGSDGKATRTASR